MSGKMNWDRVRKESLVRRHGSAWVPSIVELDRWKNKKPKTKKKLARKRRLNLGSRMPGCTCGKPVGFSGEHKRACPLCAPKGTPVNTLKELAAAIKAIGQQEAVRDVLHRIVENAKDTPPGNQSGRKEAARIIAAMLRRLED